MRQSLAQAARLSPPILPQRTAPDSGHLPFPLLVCLSFTPCPFPNSIYLSPFLLPRLTPAPPPLSFILSSSPSLLCSSSLCHSLPYSLSISSLPPPPSLILSCRDYQMLAARTLPLPNHFSLSLFFCSASYVFSGLVPPPLTICLFLSRSLSPDVNGIIIVFVLFFLSLGNDLI